MYNSPLTDTNFFQHLDSNRSFLPLLNFTARQLFLMTMISIASSFFNYIELNNCNEDTHRGSIHIFKLTILLLIVVGTLAAGQYPSEVLVSMYFQLNLIEISIMLLEAPHL